MLRAKFVNLKKPFSHPIMLFGIKSFVPTAQKRRLGEKHRGHGPPKHFTFCFLTLRIVTIRLVWS